MIEINGTCDPQFEAVREAFADNFPTHGDIGAGVSVYVDGEQVVDLVGGTTTADGTEPYSADALQLVFSTTKGATAICAHLLAQRGELDLDAPVTDYWPEFAAAGKGDVPVRWLLCHKSGLVDIDRSMTLPEALDWDTVTSALAASSPLWEPGTQHGYHAVTYGHLVGEIVHRVSGRSLGAFFADEVAGPLGLDFWIGTPDSVHDRVVPIIPMDMPPGLDVPSNPDGSPVGMIEMLDLLMGPGNILGRALSAPGGALRDWSNWNEPAVWRAEFPAANGITNASSLARMYAATVSEVDGVRLLSEATIKDAAVRQTEGPDSVIIFEIPFASGFMLDGGMAKLGSPTAFGHYGAGGSLGFGDHERGVGFGYVMNRMDLGVAGDPRTSGLIDAVYASL